MTKCLEQCLPLVDSMEVSAAVIAVIITIFPKGIISGVN